MRILIYTNILTPYRINYYKSLNEECIRNGDEFLVTVMSDTETNRSWKYEDYREEFTKLLPHKTVKIHGVEIHYNPGLKKAINSYNPDVVICGGGYLFPGTWVASKKSRNYKCLFWSESHLDEKRVYKKFTLAIRNAVRSKFYKRFDGFWYAGSMSLEFIKKYSGECNAFFYSPNLVEENKFDKKSHNDVNSTLIREKNGLPQNKKIIICPARLSTEKGLDRFLELYKHCTNRNAWIMVIAGRGNDKDKLERVIRENSLDVVLVGEKNLDDMVELYSVSSLFVLPSISDPNPLSCIEALWCGLPLLVSTNVGNHREVINVGENGFVFSYDDEDEAVKIVDNMLGLSKEWYENASRQSYAMATENYSTQKNVKRLMSEMRGEYDKNSVCG